LENTSLIFYTQNPASSQIFIHYCGWEQCSKGYSFGPAVRNHYLIHYVVHGCGTYLVNKQQYHVKAGQVFVIEPFVSTIYQADLENPWEYYWVGFYGGESSDLIKSTGFCSEQLVLNVLNPQQTQDCFCQMSDIFTQETPNRLMLLSLLYRFFAELSLSDSTKVDSHGYISNAIQYIYNNYAYPITVSEIAKQIGINRSYLYKLFMDQRGISPQQYLINHRLFVACEMLKTGRYSINEIAYSCGFNTPTHFYCIFKERYKLSPLKYKKSILLRGGTTI